MVDPSFRAAWQAGRRSTLLAGVSLGILLHVVTVITGIPGALAQESTPQADRAQAGPERVTRLQDSLDAGEDWDIGVPLMPPDSTDGDSFADLVRAGRALDSEAYLALDGEFRRVRELLQARPEDEAIRLQLEQLQDALARRIEINLEFDYLYASAVYLELFRQAAGAPETVRQLSRRLGAQRATRTE